MKMISRFLPFTKSVQSVLGSLLFLVACSGDTDKAGNILARVIVPSISGGNATFEWKTVTLKGVKSLKRMQGEELSLKSGRRLVPERLNEQ